MLKIGIIFFASFLIIGCLSSKKQVKEKDDLELWILEAQDFTDKNKYRSAIEMINKAMVKFPDKEVLALNYIVGFNYYKLRKYDEAKKYFNRVIKLFESESHNEDEYRKYVILSTKLVEKLEDDIKNRRDPYHVKEDLKENRKIRAKKE